MDSRRARATITRGNRPCNLVRVGNSISRCWELYMFILVSESRASMQAKKERYRRILFHFYRHRVEFTYRIICWQPSH